MKKYKTESCTQYTQGDITVCATTVAWRKHCEIEKKYAMVFIGCAYDQISRSFAAGILKQLRRTKALAKKLTETSK
mgnify:CR=1 FL=1